MAGKRVQLMKELVPTAKRVAWLSHPPHPTNAIQLQGVDAAARTLGLQLDPVPVRGADDFAAATVPGTSGAGDGVMTRPFTHV
jgi:putative ABC transport system substrate-binding protein